MKKKNFLFPTLLTSSFLFASLVLGGISPNASYGAHRLEARNEGDHVEAVAKYTFSDPENIGYDSATKNGTNKYAITPFEPDGHPISVTDGVVTLDGSNALGYSSKDVDPTGAMREQDHTMCWTMSLPDLSAVGGWTVPITVRFPNWDHCAMFLLSGNTNLLRYYSSDCCGDFWAPEIVTMEPDRKYNFVMSCDIDGNTNIYVDGDPVGKFNKPTYTSELGTDWGGLTFGGVFNHNGSHAIQGANGSFTHPAGMTISNLAFYDFAMNDHQANLYNTRGYLYKTDLDEQKAVTPLARYEFNDPENPGKDSSGNFNLSVNGSGVSVADGVATFTGAGSLVCANNNDLLETLAGNAFTLKATIKASNTADSIPVNLIKSNWIGGCCAGVTTWGGVLRASLRDVDGGNSVIGDTNACYGVELGTATDEHTIIYSVTPGGKGYFYADGVLKASADIANTFNLAGGDCDFALGASVWGGYNGCAFSGTIKDVRIYNFGADLGEIANLINFGEIYESADNNVVSVAEQDFSASIIVPEDASDAEIINGYAPKGAQDIEVTMKNGDKKTAKVTWDAVERREAGIYLKGTLSEVANKDNICAYAKIATVAGTVEILPLAKYNFESVDTIGKDAMGNFDLEVVKKQVAQGEGEDATYVDADADIKVEDGGVVFDGNYGLVTTEDNNIGKYLGEESTISATIKFTDIPAAAGQWAQIFGFGQNGYGDATIWDKLQVGEGSTMLRYNVCGEKDEATGASNVDGARNGAYWGNELGDYGTGAFHTVTVSVSAEKFNVYVDGTIKQSYNTPEGYKRNILASRFAVGCCFNYDQFVANTVLKDLVIYDFAATAEQVRTITASTRVTSNLVTGPYVTEIGDDVTVTLKNEIFVSTPADEKLAALKSGKVTATLSDESTKTLPVTWTEVVEEDGHWYAVGNVGLGKEHLMFSVARGTVRAEIEVSADPVESSEPEASSETPVESSVTPVESSETPVESSEAVVESSVDTPTSSETPTTSGCGGAIVGGLLVSVIAAAALVLVKSKKED